MTKVSRQLIRIPAILALFGIIGVSIVQSFPRVWSVNSESTGYTIASSTAQLYTATFNPQSFVACNQAAIGGVAIYINFSGITATAMTTALATSIKIFPQECYSFSTANPNVNETFTVAIKTTSSTADFRFIGTRE